MFGLFAKKSQSRYPDAPDFLAFVSGADIFSGDKVEITELFGKEIVILKCRLSKSKKRENSLCASIQLEYRGENRILFTGSDVLLKMLLAVEKGQNPELRSPGQSPDEEKEKIMRGLTGEKYHTLKLRPFRVRIVQNGKYYSLA